MSSGAVISGHSRHMATGGIMVAHGNVVHIDHPLPAVKAGLFEDPDHNDYDDENANLGGGHKRAVVALGRLRIDISIIEG